MPTASTKLVVRTRILYLDGLNLLLLLCACVGRLRWLINDSLTTLHLYQLTADQLELRAGRSG